MYYSNEMGDLQKGEWYAILRYLNMKNIYYFPAFLALQSNLSPSHMTSPVSEERKNFIANNPTLSDSLHLSSLISLQFIVPKSHLLAHILKCHGLFSFNYASGVGQTGCEGIEQNWSFLNGVALSVYMMGPGGQWNTLNDI